MELNANEKREQNILEETELVNYEKKSQGGDEKKTVTLKDIELEKESVSPYLERKSFRVAITGVFTALAVVLGYALAYIPNIELFTTTIFLSGFVLGKKRGVSVGLMSSFIFCFFNPMGASPLPLLSFQLSYYSLVGLCGGLTSSFLNGKPYFKPESDLYDFRVIALFGTLAAALTTFFDISSTIILALSVFGTLDAFIPSFILGLPFTIAHFACNVLSFVFVLPGLIQLTYKMLDLPQKKQIKKE